MDSGATTSIGERRFFIESTLRPCNTRIQCANGKFITCNLRGTMVIKIGGKQVKIENALCVEGVVNLLSVNQLVKKGYILVFDKELVEVYSKNEVLSGKPFMLLERKLGDKLWTFDHQSRLYWRTRDHLRSKPRLKNERMLCLQRFSLRKIWLLYTTNLLIVAYPY